MDRRVWCCDVSSLWRIVDVPAEAPQRIRVLHHEVIVFTAASVMRVRADG